MTDAIQGVFQVSCAAVGWLCILVLLLKLLWNLCVPYALIMRGPGAKPISVFVLMEVVVLLLAALSSLAAQNYHWLEPSQILLYGFAAIVGTYAHLFVVVFIAGCIGTLRRKLK